MSAGADETLSRKWDEAISDYWIKKDQEDDFLSMVYFKNPSACRTFVNVVWGSEAVENRTFRFLVSGPGGGKSDDWGVRKAYGVELGPEWDAALVRYWKQREFAEKMRRNSRELRQRGYGPLFWLQERDEWDEALSPEGSRAGGEDDGKLLNVAGVKKALDNERKEDPSVNDRNRRDSGGSEDGDIVMVDGEQ